MEMSMARIGLLLLLIAIGGACTPTPEITRRYAQFDGGVEPVQNRHVAASAFVMPVPAAASDLAIRQLSDRGQGAVISALTSGASGKDDVLHYAGLKRRKSDKIEDRTLVKRRVVLSISKTDCAISSADRIEQLRSRIASISSGVTIESWNRFSTEHETVDLGKVSLEKTFEATVEGKVGTPEKAAVAAHLLGTARDTRTLTEELSLRERRIKITGTLAPDRRWAETYQQGSVGIDLTGNSTLDLTLKMPAADDGELKHTLRFTLSAGGRRLAPKDVGFRVRKLLLPELAKNAATGKVEAVTCKISGSYRLRRVLYGQSTIMEGDDHVRFIHGEFEAGDKVEIISAATVQAAARHYAITHVRRNQRLKYRRVVLPGPGQPPRPVGDAEILYLATLGEVDELLAWLAAHAANGLIVGDALNRYGLRFEWRNGQVLTVNEVAGLRLVELP